MNRAVSNGSDLLFALPALLIIWIIGAINPTFGSILAIWLAIYYFSSGMHILNAGQMPQPAPIPSAASAPVLPSPTLAEKMASMNIPRDPKCPSCGASIRPTDRKCNYCGSSLMPLITLPQPANFGEAQVGQSIRVLHPEKGELTLTIQRCLYYGELWQEHSGANVPWTPTGAYFVGLNLSTDLFLLNWQSRFFLLDTHAPLTDLDINRDFAPYARQFGASNQTADVHFRYSGEDWHMDDIGKFRIEYCDSDGPQISPGSIGRFIHASRANRVLVVEDYQSAGSGGLDTLWQGFGIPSTAIHF